MEELRLRTEMEIQQENIKELIKLTQENTGLKIIPMVDIDVCSSDDYSCWAGSWGKPRVDECWCDDERIYFKRDDFEDLVSQYIDNLDQDTLSNFYDDAEVEKHAEEHVNNLAWEKVIVVYIGTP